MQATPITPKVTAKVAEIVRDTLSGRFTDGEFIFDPIIVASKTDHHNDEFVEITIIFDGDQKMLDADWTAGLINRILPKMDAEGIYVKHWPGKKFVEKSEWDEYQRTGIYGSS